MNRVTELLEAANRGDRQAAAELLPLVYAELRSLAAARRSTEQHLSPERGRDPDVQPPGVPKRSTPPVVGALEWVRIEQPLQERNRSSLQEKENLADLIRAVLPDVAALLDLGAATPLNRELMTESWQGKEADLLFEVPLLSGTFDHRVLVLVLLEHQSDTDPLVPLRILCCCVWYWERQWRLWQDLPKKARGPLRLSPVVPVVLYTASRPWGSNRCLTDLFDGPPELHLYGQGWEPLFWNLSEQQPQALLAGGPWMQFLAVMRQANEAWADFEPVLRQASLNLAGLAQTTAGRWEELLRLVFSYAAWCRFNSERQPLLDVLQQTNPTRQREAQAMAQTIAGAWFEEGELKGQREGMLKARRAAVREMLESRFGTLPPDYTEKLERCTDLDWLRQALLRAVTEPLDQLTPPQPG